MMLDSQALFARAADGMYVVDAALVIVEVNDAFATMMGTTRASMLGRQITGYVQREHLRLHPPQTEIVARDGSAIVMRLFQRADGTTMEGEVAATQLDAGGIFCVVRDMTRRAAVSALRSHAFDFEGHAARIVLVNDITEQARLRAREREMTEQLLHAQKMEAVGRLAGGVAHDFNNLLTVVMSAAEGLSDDLPADSPLHDGVRDIRQAVERGSALTRQLLAFGRKEVHAPVQLDVHDVVVNVERLLSRALGGGVRLERRRGPGDTRVMADASQLEQVLVNLAINARDAMPGGGSLVIATGTCVLDETAAAALELAAGSYVTMDVTDTGVGMDEMTRSRAFEPFYTTKGPLEGTGLGLSTVYGIVRQSGGAVTLASVPGAGTQVTIYLPASGEASSGSSMYRSGEHRCAPTGSTPSGCVLLVEDEPQVRAQARRLLERCGFRVLEAGDGADGLRLFEAQRAIIDAIVTDVVMPVLGGVEMIGRVRALAPLVPVVFVSGFTAEDRDLPLDARTVFVPKPYAIATLRGAIEAVIAA